MGNNATSTQNGGTAADDDTDEETEVNIRQGSTNHDENGEENDETESGNGPTSEEVKSRKSVAGNTKFTPRKTSRKKVLDDLLPPKPNKTTKQSALYGVDFKILDEHALGNWNKVCRISPMDVPFVDLDYVTSGSRKRLSLTNGKNNAYFPFSTQIRHTSTDFGTVSAEASDRFLFGSFFDLVTYLTDNDAWDDFCKARVLFRWVTSYDIPNMRIEVEPPENSPLEFFLKIQCELASYANLYVTLCQIAEVHCVVIDGLSKHEDYELAKPINKNLLASQWNAVYIDGEWRLVDCFWSVACAEGVQPDEGAISAVGGLDFFIPDDDAEDDNISLSSQTAGPSNVNGNSTSRRPSAASRAPTRIGTSRVPRSARAETANIQRKKFVKLTDKDLAKLKWKRENGAIVDEHYFFANASELISTHLPNENHWQLVEEPITMEEFEKQAYIRERFYQLGMKITDAALDKCVFDSENGEVVLDFNLPLERSKNFNFKYMLFRSDTTPENRSKLDEILDRFVIFEHREDILSFTFQFPIKGEFKLLMYGLDRTEENIDTYDLICMYLLNIKESEKYVPLPDFPAIGWGPGVVSQSCGVFPISHKYSQITTEDGFLQIVLGAKERHRLRFTLRNPFAKKRNLDKYAILRGNDSEYTIELRLPEKGSYALKIYARRTENSQEHTNVLNYLIRCVGENLIDEPYPYMRSEKLGPTRWASVTGVEYLGKEDGFIDTKNGYAHLHFKKPSDMILNCEFYPHRFEHTERIRVTQACEEEKQSFFADLPETGTFSMNVFARKKGAYEDFYLTHCFVVKSLGREIIYRGTHGQNLKKLFWRDFPTIVPEIITTNDTEVFVPVPQGYEKVVAYVEKVDSENPMNKREIEQVVEKGIPLYRVPVPEKGEYAIDILHKHEKLFLKCLKRYLVYQSEAIETNEFLDELIEVMNLIREERMKHGQDVSELDLNQQLAMDNKVNNVQVKEKIKRAQEIHSSVQTKNPEIIRRTLTQSKLSEEEQSQELVLKAQKILFYHEAKKELTEAYKSKELQALEDALLKARKANDDGSLSKTILLATRLRDRLLVLQRLKDHVMDVDYKTVGELKHYDNPHDGVHQCVRAALVVLGHEPEEVKYWVDCQAILGRTGKDYVIERMASFSPNDCSAGMALYAYSLIRGYSESQINVVSPLAAGFYLWTLRMIKEVEKLAEA